MRLQITGASRPGARNPMTEQTERPQYMMERMTEHHNVSSFDCQHTYLNSFLKEKALEETKRDLSLTFVLLDYSQSPPIVTGYFTLRADSYYPEAQKEVDLIPVVELVALARDITCHGQGIVLLWTLRRLYQLPLYHDRRYDLDSAVHSNPIRKWRSDLFFTLVRLKKARGSTSGRGRV